MTGHSYPRAERNLHGIESYTIYIKWDKYKINQNCLTLFTYFTCMSRGQLRSVGYEETRESDLKRGLVQKE